MRSIELKLWRGEHGHLSACLPAALMDITDLSHCGELNCRLLGGDMGHTGAANRRGLKEGVRRTDREMEN